MLDLLGRMENPLHDLKKTTEILKTILAQ